MDSPATMASKVLGLAMTALPWVAIAAAVAIVAVLIIKHWEKIKAFLLAVWGALSRFFRKWGRLILVIATGGLGLLLLLFIRYFGAIKGAVRAAIGAVVGFVRRWGRVIVGIMTAGLSELVGLFIRNFGLIRRFAGNILSFFRGTWNAVRNAISAPFRAAFNVIIGLFQRIWAWIKKIAGAIPSLLNKIPGAGLIKKGIGGIGGLLGFDKGGVVPGRIGEPMLAVVHGGEEVVPYRRRAVGFTGGSTPSTVIVQIDGRDFMRLLRGELIRLKKTVPDLGFGQ